LATAGGFDHCYVLRDAASVGTNGAAPPLRQVARAYDPGSGRELTVSTDQRGLQFYSGNWLKGDRGRGGVAYQAHAGLCLEAGGFPNQVNMAEQEEVIMRAGSTYRQVTAYRVGVRQGV
jgi:aldose 1-epimerase